MEALTSLYLDPPTFRQCVTDLQTAIRRYDAGKKDANIIQMSYGTAWGESALTRLLAGRMTNEWDDPICLDISTHEFNQWCQATDDLSEQWEHAVDLEEVENFMVLADQFRDQLTQLWDWVPAKYKNH